MNVFELSGVWKSANNSMKEEMRFTQDEMSELLALARRLQNLDDAHGFYLMGQKTTGVQINIGPWGSTIFNITKGRHGDGPFTYSMGGAQLRSFQTSDFTELLSYARGHIETVINDPSIIQSIILQRAPECQKLKHG